jgi:drug/metabolite transporter (DMT)-like permease
MSEQELRPSLPASLFVVSVGSLWGLYWLPLRELEAVARAGPWTTLAVVLIGCLTLAPFAWLGRSRLRGSRTVSLASLALGGASFVLYSNGLLYGQVAVVILFFYLTPVWSTLIVRFWLGWPVAPARLWAIAFGLIGIVLVLQGSHPGLPVPKTLGDLLGLSSGLLWSIAATGIHLHSRAGAAESTFVFCTGGTIMAGFLALVLPGEMPEIPVGQLTHALAWVLILGVGWWGASLTGFMWATRRLEPARVGILLMSEVVVGSVSAAILAAEPFGLLMTLGAFLVVSAGGLEALSQVFGQARKIENDLPAKEVTPKGRN